VLALFRVVFTSVRRHYQTVERLAGVNGAQLWALAHVAGNPGMRVGALAAALAIHQSTASNLLRELADAGLVSRRRARGDQREVRLNTTEKGAATLRRAPRPLIGVLQQALSDLPAGELAAIHRTLVRLVAMMQRKDAAAGSIPLSHV